MVFVRAGREGGAGEARRPARDVRAQQLPGQPLAGDEHRPVSGPLHAAPGPVCQ